MGNLTNRQNRYCGGKNTVVNLKNGLDRLFSSRPISCYGSFKKIHHIHVFVGHTNNADFVIHDEVEHLVRTLQKTVIALTDISTVLAHTRLISQPFKAFLKLGYVLVSLCLVPYLNGIEPNTAQIFLCAGV